MSSMLIGLGLMAVALSADDAVVSPKLVKHSELGIAFECPADWTVEVETSEVTDTKNIRIAAPPEGSCIILINRDPPSNATTKELEQIYFGSQDATLDILKGTMLEDGEQQLEHKIMKKVRKGRRIEYSIEPVAGLKLFARAEAYVFDAPSKKDRIAIAITHGNGSRKFQHSDKVDAFLESLREIKTP